MNEIQLLELIKKRLDEINAKFDYPAPATTERRPITVFLFDYPAKRSRSNEPDDHPSILLVPVKGSSPDHLTNTVNVDIYITMYEDTSDHQGWIYAHNVLDRIRCDFFSRPVIDCGPVFNNVFNWEKFDEQTAPYYTIAIETQWKIKQPQNTQVEDLI